MKSREQEASLPYIPHPTPHAPCPTLILIFLLSLTIRLYHHHHILMSDEANNMLTIKALIEGEGLREYFFKHPPLFTVLSSIISYPFGDNLHIVQGLSILFSSAAFFPFYLIIEKVFDRRTALLSLAILAVLPMNILYSTWIKQDAMLLFFFLCSLYLYMTERYWSSAFMFGLASLTKEFALFLIPIVLGWEVIKGWDWKKAAGRFLQWLMTGAAISGWWYAFFGAESFRAIDAAAAGGNLREFFWHFPWYYYIRNLRADLTLILIPFFATGLLWVRKEKGFLLLIIWLSAFYLPLSLMTVKAPWYTYLASPAISVLTVVGIRGVKDIISFRYLRIIVYVILVVYLSLSTYNFNSDSYYQWLISGKVPLYDDIELLTKGREILKGDRKVALLEYRPPLQYYLGIPDRRRVYLGPQFPAMDRERLTEQVGKKDIGWFVIDTESINYLEKNLSDLTYLYGEPIRVGNVLIFKVEKGNIP